MGRERHDGPAVELAYNCDGTEHEDIVLRFGDAETRSDSYWIARDNNLRPDDRSPAKVRLVIAQLLRQWERDVTTLEIGATACLPWDFSDQYSGWVRVEREDADRLSLVLVWTEELTATGVFLAATDYGSGVPHISKFNEDQESPRLQVTRDDFLAAIRMNRAHYQTG